MRSALSFAAAGVIGTLLGAPLAPGFAAEPPHEERPPVAVVAGSPAPETSFTAGAADVPTPVPSAAIRPSEEPDRPARRVDVQLPDGPLPRDTRIKVPGLGFAVTIPAGWRARIGPVDPAVPDGRIGLLADSPDGVSCLATRVQDVPASPVVPWMDSGWFWGLSARIDRGLLRGVKVIDRDMVELSRVPAYRVTTARGKRSTSWYFTDGAGFYRLACGPVTARPKDKWRSLAETFELLQARQLPTGDYAPGYPIDPGQVLDRFVLDNVAPGIDWVVYDNERDLTELHGSIDRVIAADDGSTWAYGDQGFYALGGYGHEWGARVSGRSAVDTDGGLLWAIRRERRGQPQLYSADHGTLDRHGRADWKLRKAAPKGGSVDGVDIRPDGSAWAWWSDKRGRTTIGRLEEGRWRRIATLGAEIQAMTLTDDGIWALVREPGRDERAARVLHHDGRQWRELELPSSAEWTPLHGDGWTMAVGPSGDVWLKVETCRPHPEVPDWPWCTPGLARFDRNEWTHWDWEAEPPRAGGSGPLEPGRMVGVDGDGRLWFRVAEVC